jgi:hypothetical protein
VERCFFYCFCSLHGRYHPCCAVFCDRVGKGGAVHVFWMIVVILLMSMSREVHAFCHCPSVRESKMSVFMRVFIWTELVSRNWALNFSRLVDGIGLSILGVCRGRGR